MKDGYIDDFDLKRIIKAVEEDLVVKPLEKPEVVVQHHKDDNTTAHVVNLEKLTCTCEDFKFNCKPEEKELGDNKYCKHLIRAVLEKHRML